MSCIGVADNAARVRLGAVSRNDDLKRALSGRRWQSFKGLSDARWMRREAAQAPVAVCCRGW